MKKTLFKLTVAAVLASSSLFMVSCSNEAQEDNGTSNQQAQTSIQQTEQDIVLNTQYKTETVDSSSFTLVSTSGQTLSVNFPSSQFLNKGTVIGNYWIADCEVTAGLYKAVMDGNKDNINPAPSYVKEKSTYNEDNSLKPVNNVTLYDAIFFCNRLSELSGLQKVYGLSIKKVESGSITSADVTIDTTKNGYRLPTATEWEYSARGAAHLYKYTFAGSKNYNEVCWWGNNASWETHQVKLKNPVAADYLVYDMSGNVAELTWSPIDNNNYRYCGGSALSKNAGDCDVYTHGGVSASEKRNDIGFRIARNM